MARRAGLPGPDGRQRLVRVSLALAVLLTLGIWLLWEKALPPLPIPEVEPLPEAARALLWVECGARPEESRSLGAHRVLGEYVGMFTHVRTDRFMWSPMPRTHLADRTISAFHWPSRGPSRLPFLPDMVRVARWWTAEQALDFVGDDLSFGDFGGLTEASWVYYGMPLHSLDDAQIATLIVSSRSQRHRHLAWTEPQVLLDWTRDLMIKAGKSPLTALTGLMPAPDRAWSSLPLEETPEPGARQLAYCQRRAALLQSCHHPHVHDPYAGQCAQERASCTDADMALLEQQLDCIEAIPCKGAWEEREACESLVVGSDWRRCPDL